MKKHFSLFSRTNVCKPLVNTEGKHVEKYRVFRTFLDHNHRALSALAFLEQLYFGASPYARISVQCGYEELLEAAWGAVYCLEKMTPGAGRPLEAVLRDADSLVSREFASVPRASGREFAIPLDRITRDHAAHVGAKSLNLALLRNELGLPVPRGFAVTTNAFERFLEGNGLAVPLAGLLSTLTPESLSRNREISRIVQERILASPVPDDVAAALLNAFSALERTAGKNVKTAVRSSALGEDASASFAGQYTTVLNVEKEALLDAYKNVLAGLYSPEAVAYRMRYGLEDRDTPMAAAVVEMVGARSSGVMYTRDVSGGGADVLRINALWGLGERLVDGSASADAFIIGRNDGRIERREIVVKNQRLINAPQGGTTVQEVPEEDRTAPCLSEEEARRLADYGLRIERYFGAPQDIEWTVDAGGEIFLLQTRPLHAVEAPGEQSRQEPVNLPLLLSGGVAAWPGLVSAPARILRDGDDGRSVPDNCIVVARTASPGLARFAGRISGIITDVGSVTSHLGSVVREFGIPALFDAKNAVSGIPDGMVITLDATRAAVYAGALERPAAALPRRNDPFVESPLHRRTRRILDLVAPLNLTDPSSPDFTPQACRTVHDVLRCVHELVIKAMFGLSEEADAVRSAELTAHIPFNLRLVDLGGGLKPGLTTCETITPDDIESIPLRALWKGFTHPGISWEGTINFDPKRFLTLIASSAVSEFGSEPGGTSYAVVSSDYANVSMKFGYHFAVIDALCGDDAGQNYAALQFAGGAGSYFGRSLRIALLANVLGRLGFATELKGDLLEASLHGQDRSSLEHTLDQTGRLLASSRLLDMTLTGQADIERFTDAFFRGDYDFLSSAPGDEFAHFYTHGGWWKRSSEDGRPCLIQDGSRAGFRLSSGVAGIMSKFMGPAVQDFLDRIEAYYYFPLAAVKNSEMTDGAVSVRVKPMSGRIDQAGGLAFGLTSVSDYFVLRLNALEDNIILFEYVHSKRVARASVSRTIARNEWHTLAVSVKGACVEGFLNGEKILDYCGGKPITGFIGLWTKADSVTAFADLTVGTDALSRVIEPV